jgi:hypothetical protein
MTALQSLQQPSLHSAHESKKSTGEELECYHSAGVHVADVGGDPWRVDDIVEVQHGDERVHLHEHRQRLADPARRAEDRDLEPRRAAGLSAVAHLQSHAQRHSSRFNSGQITPSWGNGSSNRRRRGARTCGARRVEVRGDAARGGSWRRDAWRGVGRCRGRWLARGTGGIILVVFRWG